MPLQTVFSTGQDKSGNLNQIAFVIIVLAITFGWLLVSVWQRVLENFAFGTLGLNEQSTLHSFLIAVSVTIIFLITIWMLDQYNIVPNIESDVERASGDVLEDADRQLSDVITNTLGQGTQSGTPGLTIPPGGF